ncbi:MAG TPA: response regulator [Candidatus Angelobacter sp.]|nr:response regulator [Candidatus Angelobacter sp.]
MSLRILFADDSMTAQNMGKKILSEAGYDVVAVSNGAAAVKKIAEQKPDIIILDVYMPGYSGLEVCEKVRGSLDTLKIPVLLTVGKMEPYKPEDANRVKADGVIIKPFEASDLLAIVKKFEERIGQMPAPPIVEQTVRIERQYQEDAIEEAHMQSHATGKTGMQPMVEVPDHMAGSSAFPDMLSAESAAAPQHFAVNTPAAAFETSVIVPAPPIPSAEYDLPVAWQDKKIEPVAPTPAQPEPEIVATPIESLPEPVAEPEPATPEAEVSAPATEASSPEEEINAPEPPHPQFIPVFQEPEPPAYEVVHTAAPPVGDLEIPREPALQETAEEATRTTVADHVEPGLLSTLSQSVETGPAKEPESSTAWPPNVPSSASEAAPARMEAAPNVPVVAATSEVSDADFEARVAAAMAAYSHTAEPPAAETESASEPHTVSAEAAPTQVDSAQLAAVPEAEAEPAPSFEYHPPVRVPEAAMAEPVAVTQPEAASPVASASTPMHAASMSAPAVPEPEEVHSVVTAGLEAAAVAAAAETGAEHHTIAQAVHRVMERLKPELVDEILREIRSKK